MNSTTLSSILLLSICCGWPLIVHVAIIWITRRDWSTTGEVFSRIISSLFHKDEDQ